MKEGNKVVIYQRPGSKTYPEGPAILLDYREFYTLDGSVFEKWLVRLEDGAEVERLICTHYANTEADKLIQIGTRVRLHERG